MSGRFVLIQTIFSAVVICALLVIASLHVAALNRVDQAMTKLELSVAALHH